MRLRSIVAILLFAASARLAAAEPAVLSEEVLDRITAGASASAELALGNAPLPQTQPEPPKRPRDFLPWLRRLIGCSLPGRVCIQG